MKSLQKSASAALIMDYAYTLESFSMQLPLVPSPDAVLSLPLLLNFHLIELRCKK